jgi:signal transduction histidine kinase
MVTSRGVKKYGGLLLVVGIGAGLFVVHGAHALGEDEDFQTFLLGILLPMVFAGSVFAGGVWLWRQDSHEGSILRVGLWCALGTAVLALGAVLVILYQQQHGVMLDDQLFVVVNGASGGALVGFTIGLYDIRQRRAQARVDQLNRQLTVLNRVLRHDIRNSANVIQGNADLLTHGATDTTTKADTIKKQAADLVKLGRQAKQIERVLDGEGQKRQDIEITSVVESCCERIRRDYPEAEIETSLPDARRVVTHQLIDSALMNVIKNAVEHNDKQTPHVTIESMSVSHGGTDYVEIRVADNGPGIPGSEVEVLERGYETNLDHLSGLGLWLVNWIVTNAEGEIKFEENEPEGSVVCLRMKHARRSTSSVSNTADPVAQRP